LFFVTESELRKPTTTSLDIAVPGAEELPFSASYTSL